MRILIIGAGAVGGYFGGRLAAAGRDVTFLVRPKRAEQLRRTGLQIVSPYGDVSMEPKLLLAEELRAKPQTFDLILVSTKSYSLDAAIEDFAPAIGRETAILPLLNGMRHLDTLVARFGETSVLGGTTRISADLDPEGRILQVLTFHNVLFGERDKQLTRRVQVIDETLRDCGFPSRLSPDIIAAMWGKWFIISSFAGLNCLLRGTIGAIVAAPGGPETARALLAESAAIVAANGYPQSQEAIEMQLGRATEPGSTFTASMYRDVTKGAPVEADHLLGDFIARGRVHGVAAPLLQAAYAQLAVYAAARQPA